MNIKENMESFLAFQHDRLQNVQDRIDDGMVIQDAIARAENGEKMTNEEWIYFKAVRSGTYNKQLKEIISDFMETYGGR